MLPAFHQLDGTTMYDCSIRDSSEKDSEHDYEYEYE